MGKIKEILQDNICDTICEHSKISCLSCNHLNNAEEEIKKEITKALMPESINKLFKVT